MLRTNITVLLLLLVCLHSVSSSSTFVDLPTDCILSFLFPAETDVLVPVFSQSTDVVVVNFVVVLKLPIIVEPLTEIINLSLVSGCFPETLKIAKVLQKSLKIIGPFPFFQLFLNFTKKWFIIVSINT